MACGQIAEDQASRKLSRLLYPLYRFPAGAQGVIPGRAWLCRCCAVRVPTNPLLKQSDKPVPSVRKKSPLFPRCVTSRIVFDGARRDNGLLKVSVHKKVRPVRH